MQEQLEVLQARSHASNEEQSLSSSQTNASQELSHNVTSNEEQPISSSQTNASQEQKPQTTKPKCNKCNKGKTSKTASCYQLCRTCCLEHNQGRCSVHKYHKHGLVDFQSFFLDFEATTNRQLRA